MDSSLVQSSASASSMTGLAVSGSVSSSRHQDKMTVEMSVHGVVQNQMTAALEEVVNCLRVIADQACQRPAWCPLGDFSIDRHPITMEFGNLILVLKRQSFVDSFENLMVKMLAHARSPFEFVMPELEEGFGMSRASHFCLKVSSDVTARTQH